jgi:acyl carrier protein
MDSLDAVNLIYEIEERFNISVPDHSFRSIKNVRELIHQLQTILAASAPSQISLN